MHVFFTHEDTYTQTYTHIYACVLTNTCTHAQYENKQKVKMNLFHMDFVIVNQSKCSN